MPARRWFTPRTLAGSATGTSSGGNSNARFPGEDFSKINSSFWLVWRDTFLIFLPICLFVCIGTGRGGVPAKEYVSLNRPLQRVLQRACKSLDFRARRQFGDAHQRVLGQFRIRRAQCERSDDFVAQQL